MIFILWLALQHPIEKLLNETNNVGNIISIIETFQEDEYQNIFIYVPNINPLNPNKMKRFSSVFGERFHPIDKTKKKHFGLDLSANKNLPVHVSAAGKVVFTGYSSGFGKYIIIEHKYGFVTKYAHLNQILTKPNNQVKKGEIIGRVGTTGNSTGDHLHYEILKNGKHIDPFPLVTLK